MTGWPPSPASRSSGNWKSTCSACCRRFSPCWLGARERPPLQLPEERVSIETRIEQLLDRLSETKACGFEDLFVDVATRSSLITTFLALLEMIRLQLIRVFQAGTFNPIRVYKRARPDDAPRPMGDVRR